jgi:hypothetical protein
MASVIDGAAVMAEEAGFWVGVDEEEAVVEEGAGVAERQSPSAHVSGEAQLAREPHGEPKRPLVYS